MEFTLEKGHKKLFHNTIYLAQTFREEIRFKRNNYENFKLNFQVYLEPTTSESYVGVLALDGKAQIRMI
jgi:hypothetical protein